MNNFLKYIYIYCLIFSVLSCKNDSLTARGIISESRSFDAIQDSLLNFKNYSKSQVKLTSIDSIATEVEINDTINNLYVNGILIDGKKYGWWLLKNNKLRIETEYLILNQKEHKNQMKLYESNNLDSVYSFFYKITPKESTNKYIKYNLSYFTGSASQDSIIYGFKYFDYLTKSNKLIESEIQENEINFSIKIPKNNLPYFLEGTIYDLPIIGDTILTRRIYVNDTLIPPN